MKATAFLLYTALLSGFSMYAQAQEIFSGDTLKVRFNNWAGLGFAPEVSVGRIDSRSWIVNGLSDGSMDFGDTKTGGDFGRGISNGRVTTGGLYAFTPATDIRLLGFQPTGTDLAPGMATLKIQLDNNLTTSGVGVSYDMWAFNDQGRNTVIELEWSTDGVNFVAANGGGTMTSAAAQVGVQWVKQTASVTLPTGEVMAGGTFFIRWIMRDGTGTGSRDEWGLEEIRVYGVVDSDDEDDGDDDEEEITPPYEEKPTIQAQNIRQLARSDTSLHVAWDRGNGDYSILMALSSGITNCETDTSTTYDANPNMLLAGLTKNGCRVLWSGIGDQAIIIGLQPLESVMFTVLEFNGENGRENYLEDGQEVVSYQTRAKSPPPIEMFRVQLVTFDDVTLTWTTPAQGSVKVLIADDVPSATDILGHLDGMETNSGLINSGCVASPCTISRDLIGSKQVIAFAFDGPEGHQSIQKMPFAVWEASWPDPSTGRLLAEWSFDEESIRPTWSVWEHQGVEVTVNGARGRGFATGYSGKASYTDQWHNANLEKSWTLLLTTHGLSSAQIEFRVISSASGPARFHVLCDVQNQYLTSPQIVEASSTWATSIIQKVELPAPCLNQARVKLMISPLDDVAMNGNPISRSGTSRLDDVRLYGNYIETATPLMGDLQLTANTDAGVSITGNWISAIGKWPTKQSLKMESKGNVEEIFSPVPDLISVFEIDGLEPATNYQISHCGYVGEANSCSKPIEFATPYEPPTMPVITHQRFIEPDSLELNVASGGFDVVVVYAPFGVVQPVLSDSIGMAQFDATGYKYISRSSNQRPLVIGGLRPGSHYRFWVIAVAGPDSIGRYSKPEHPYIDVVIPRLAEPEMPLLEMRLQGKSMNTVSVSTSEPDTSSLLFTIAPYGTQPSRPENDVFYQYGTQYSQGDRIGDETYVIAGTTESILTVMGLPLGSKWIIRAFAFKSLHGSITYSRSYSEIVFETLPDPVKNPMTANEVWNTAEGDTIATTGTVMWINARDFVVKLTGGNLMLTGPQVRISQIIPPQEIALVAMMNESNIEIIDFRLLGEPAHRTIEAHVVHPDSSNTAVYGHAQVAIGNVLETNVTCEDGSQMYRQRGSQPRMICLVGERPTDESGSNGIERAVTGYPLYNPSLPHINILVASTSDITAYLPSMPVLLSPNMDQLISWTKYDDTDVEFNWKIQSSHRPYDQFPDSVATFSYFLTRRADQTLVNVIKLDSSERSLNFRASELHRTHSTSDSLQLTTELEWAVGLYGIGDEVNDGIELRNWVSFQLLRLKALVETDVMDIPNEFILEPARPNPFNPSTTIRVHLPAAGYLDIVAYDILGRRLSSIHSGGMKPGVFDFRWNAVQYPSGIYIVRARFGDHFMTQTVTLLK